MTATKHRVRQRPEEALHIAVARYLDVALPADAMWWHTPNGGRRSKSEAARFKAMGTVAGVSDLLIFYRGKLIGIELKATARIDPTDAQLQWGRRLQAAGGKWCVCSDLQGVDWYIRYCGIPLRATLQMGGGWRKA